MNEHILISLSRRYPQLLLPIREGMKDTPEYRAAVLGGEDINGTLDFSMDSADTLTLHSTPAGTAEVLFLNNRADFEHCIQHLAYRCEPRPVPPSMGASTISGLINWQKIYAHKAEYKAAGHQDWSEEFGRFTSVRENFRDTLIILSSGDYSAVTAETVGLEPEAWKQASIDIRKYHELTHFVLRRICPKDIAAVRDEVFADAIGITAAFGTFIPAYARIFLGTEGGDYRQGGRLQNYLSDGETIEAAMQEANTLIDTLAARNMSGKGDAVLDRLLHYAEGIYQLPAE